MKNWKQALNGATKNWQKNRMWFGAKNIATKVVHVNNGENLCSIEVDAKMSGEKCSALFKELFGIDTISNNISFRG